MIGKTEDSDLERAKHKAKAAFRARSKKELEAEEWEQFTVQGLERLRVLGGWLYRALDGDPRTQPMTFVPDPPRYVYAAAVLPPPQRTY